MRVLVVEDDGDLAAGLRRDLAVAGFAVDVTGNALDAAHLGAEEDYDAVVLDLGLPDGSGLEVLRGWRASGNALPVLVLTARDAWYEKVEGFKAGADDYLGKPFHTEELTARLLAVIRRAYHGTPGGGLQAGALVLDEARQCVTIGEGGEIPLTGTEFRLLRYFMLNPGRILSKTRLMEHVYEYDADKDSNVLEVYVNRLRQKLGGGFIRTRRGQGYVFVTDGD